MIWFTSDRHFGHANILKFSNRPFASVEEMDEALIVAHNSRVKSGDIFYDLGDFAFTDNHDAYLSRLNGEGHLLPGNHDHRRRLKKVKGWHTIEEKLVHLKLPDTTELVLCHYALRVWRNSHHGAIHLYGHSHGNLPGDSRSCDVGVDCRRWNFAPVSLEEIRDHLSCFPDRLEPDHHQPKVTA
jgi:calcineurin-like phosphoesterase family protein